MKMMCSFMIYLTTETLQDSAFNGGFITRIECFSCKKVSVEKVKRARWQTSRLTAKDSVNISHFQFKQVIYLCQTRRLTPLNKVVLLPLFILPTGLRLLNVSISLNPFFRQNI